MTDAQKRAQLRRWMEDRIEGEASLDLPEVTDELTASILEDETLAFEFLREYLRPLVYQIGTQLMRRTRGERVIQLGDEILTQSEFEARAEDLGSRFERWMENAAGQYINFMKMTGSQLIAAAEQREKAAHSSLYVAKLERRLEQNVEDDQRVEEVYTPDQVEDIYDEIRGVKKEVAA